MRVIALSSLLAAAFVSQDSLMTHAFAPKAQPFVVRSHTSLSSTKTNAPATAGMPDLTFTKPDTTGIEDQACIDAAQKMERLAVPVSEAVSPSGSVGISYIHWEADPKKKQRGAPPLLLIHGFDSSGLEYRRLGPQLAAQGLDAYAVDILGWGFTQQDKVASFSADAKIEALQSFVATQFGADTPFCVAGASLGGAAAIELAASRPDQCAGLILIDAQGFVDGVGPMALLPTPVAKLGVGVLKSVPLRNSANQMSYFDKETFATEEAQVIGRIHTLREGWQDAMVSFMQSGGFSPSSKVPTIESPALILWGRQDGILDGEEYANKVGPFTVQWVKTRLYVILYCTRYACLTSCLWDQFVEALPNAKLEWIEECGHVPHLEQPEITSSLVKDFMVSQQVLDKKPSKAVAVTETGAMAAMVASTSSEEEEGLGKAELYLLFNILQIAGTFLVTLAIAGSFKL